jgi:hypothetical protein
VWAAALHAGVERFDPWLPMDHAVQFCMRDGSTPNPPLTSVQRRVNVRSIPLRSICRPTIGHDWGGVPQSDSGGGEPMSPHERKKDRHFFVFVGPKGSFEYRIFSFRESVGYPTIYDIIYYFKGFEKL